MGEPQTLIKTNIMFSIVFIVALIALANAHNWVNSPSRSVQANTVPPALPSSTGQPHVQVIAGQPFQIEWVQGHGRDVWFVFVAAADHKKMALHTSKYMDAYLDEAGATKVCFNFSKILFNFFFLCCSLLFLRNMRNIIANTRLLRWKMVVQTTTLNVMCQRVMQITSLVMLRSKDHFQEHRKIVRLSKMLINFNILMIAKKMIVVHSTNQRMRRTSLACIAIVFACTTRRVLMSRCLNSRKERNQANTSCTTAGQATTMPSTCKSLPAQHQSKIHMVFHCHRVLRRRWPCSNALITASSWSQTFAVRACASRRTRRRASGSARVSPSSSATASTS